MKVLYTLAWLCAWILRSVIRYRHHVIYDNLRRSLPELSDASIHQLQHDYYAYLSELIVETLKLYSMSEKRLRSLIRFENPEVLKQFEGTDRRVIVMMGHSGNWELAGALFSVEFNVPIYPVYRPIKNKKINSFYLRLRSRFGGRPVSEKEVMKKMNLEPTPLVVAMLADQSPPKRSGLYVDFLNQPTGFFRGSEVLAKRLENSAVVFAHIRRAGRGDYRIVLEESRPDLMAEKHGLLKQFVRFLESEIQGDPVNWLWSHKRWKHAPDENSRWMT